MNNSYLHNSGADEDAKCISEYKNSGSLDVLGRLYEPYMPLVYGVALKYLKDKDLSKDVVMQVFEVLIEKIKAHEIANFKSWLYVLSRNHCLMLLRKDQKNKVISLDDSFMESEPFLHHDNGIDREAQLSAMEKCLDTLDELQKQSIHLFYIQQMCYAQVAEKTGYDLKKVKSYIQNGKRNLKICIEKKIE